MMPREEDKETMLKDTYESKTMNRSSRNKMKEHEFTIEDQRLGPHEDSIPFNALEGVDEE